MEELYAQMLMDLEEANTELEKELAGISDETAARHISPGTWSIADCVVHLTMIEFSVLTIIRKHPVESSIIHTSPTIIGREKLKAELLDRSKKVKLPESFASRMETLPLQKAWEKLQSTRKFIREYVTSEKMTSPELVYPHPVLGNMTKVDWLFTAAFHSMRHTEQIREIKKRLTEINT